MDFFFNLDIHNCMVGDSMQPHLSVNIEWGQMYVNFIFSKYISHKKEIKVNNSTQDYGQD